jgi:DnaJ-domain-containing protein 1
MVKKKKSDFIPHISPDNAPACQIAGCKEAGIYKAPKSKSQLHEYQWLCLDHIREYNQQWDFFDGFDREQIESFIKDATYGHRPTWSRETHMSHKQFQQLQDALYEFLEMGIKAPKPAPALPPKLRKALAILDMEYPCTTPQLKKQYRAMVKKHHPDVNKGNKESEEKFKQITIAYTTLLEHLKSA